MLESKTQIQALFSATAILLLTSCGTAEYCSSKFKHMAQYCDTVECLIAVDSHVLSTVQNKRGCSKARKAELENTITGLATRLQN